MRNMLVMLLSAELSEKWYVTITLPFTALSARPGSSQKKGQILPILSALIFHKHIRKSNFFYAVPIVSTIHLWPCTHLELVCQNFHFQICLLNFAIQVCYFAVSYLLFWGFFFDKNHFLSPNSFSGFSELIKLMQISCSGTGNLDFFPP